MLDINSTINLNSGVPEFKKIKVGVKKLDDAILDLGTSDKPDRPFRKLRRF